MRSSSTDAVKDFGSSDDRIPSKNPRRRKRVKRYGDVSDHVRVQDSGLKQSDDASADVYVRDSRVGRYYDHQFTDRNGISQISINGNGNIYLNYPFSPRPENTAEATPSGNTKATFRDTSTPATGGTFKVPKYVDLEFPSDNNDDSNLDNLELPPLHFDWTQQFPLDFDAYQRNQLEKGFLVRPSESTQVTLKDTPTPATSDTVNVGRTIDLGFPSDLDNECDIEYPELSPPSFEWEQLIPDFAPPLYLEDSELSFFAFGMHRPGHRYALFTNMGTHRSSSAELDLRDEPELESNLDDNKFFYPHGLPPTLEGFKAYITKLWPRLDTFLADSIASNQLLQYNRLLNARVEHDRRCVDSLCAPCNIHLNVGRDLELVLISNAAAKIPTPTENAENDPEGTFKGLLTPGNFPTGIPMPPTLRLPDLFTCPICFQLKVFQNPSDWAKHVLEDVRPYTCRFSECKEFKSFERKADWIRHESERHRRLEWWKCNQHDCAHLCYRRDDFVQHLVREHKTTVPKIKTRLDPHTRKSRSPTDHDERDDLFWKLVDHCHHKEIDDHLTVPCNFCGKVSSTWRKHNFHVAEHMEQVALATLELVQRIVATKNNTVPLVDETLTATQSYLSLKIRGPTSDVDNIFGTTIEPIGPEYLHAQATENSVTPPYHSDSGYASLRIMEGQVIFGKLPDPHQLALKSQLHAVETNTIYSDGSSIGTTKREDLVHRFAESLSRDLVIQGIDNFVDDSFYNELEDLLADFATRLQQNGSSLMLQKAMAFIYKNRRSVRNTFQNMSQKISDEDTERPCDLSEKLPVAELMKMWYDRGGLESAHVPEIEEPEIEEPEIEEPEIEEPEIEEPEIEEPEKFDQSLNNNDEVFEDDAQMYERLVTDTPAYRWLIASLRNKILLTKSGQGDAIVQIRQEVYKYIPKLSRMSKLHTPEPTEAIFEMDWTNEMFSDIRQETLLDSTLAVTGSDQQAQALTCYQYLEQTWPTNGLLLWKLVKDAILRPDSVACDEGKNMSAQLLNHSFVFTVVGLRGTIAEIAEQLCWINAVFTFVDSAPEHHISFCVPSIKFVSEHSRNGPSKYDSGSELNMTNRIIRFDVSASLSRYSEKSLHGTCWLQLFKKCVIIQDYPILRRVKPDLGLELSLGLITNLVGTRYLHRFDGHLFFKQFSMMLAPSVLEDDMLVWHLCKGTHGNRISYLDHGMSSLCPIDFDKLLQARHVIGWCSNIRHLAGHADADYEVEDTELNESPYTGALFKCNLSLGRAVSGGADVRYSSNHQPVSVSFWSYLDRYQYLESQFVFFWDLATTRGWMVSGLRALLHILRQSFKVDEKKDPRRKLFVLRPQDLTESDEPWSALAAREFLSDPQNLAAKISICNVKSTGEYEYETLSERLDRLYGVLEQAFDHQSKQRDWSLISRGSLEGWDFLSIAQKKHTIPASVLNLHTKGKIWVDFVRATNAVTLIGEGFGEMLRSATPTCDPMPVDQSYMAIAVSDLSQIVGMKRCKSGPKPQFVCQRPLIAWYSPSGSSSECGCEPDNKISKESRQYVQVMWPAAHTSSLPVENTSFALQKMMKGAIIFGHDESLPCYIPDFGNAPIYGSLPLPGIAKDLEMIDSGIGSSIDSMTNLAKAPTRSTLSPMPDHPDTLSRASSQGQTYGPSSVSGGNPIFGNMYVNHIHHYPPSSDHGLGRSSSYMTQATSAENHTNWLQIEEAHIQQFSPELRAQLSGRRAESRNEADSELLNGEKEIIQLGLENYCTVFRC